MTNAGKKIGLLHHVWGGNLGDGGTLDAVIQNIKARWADAEIIGLTMNPTDTLRRHGIQSYPIRQQTLNGSITAGETPVTSRQKAKALLRRYPILFELLRAINFVAIRVPRSVVKEFLLLARAIRLLMSLDLLIVSGGGQLIESSGGPWAFLGGPWQFPFTIFKWIICARALHVKCIVLNVGAGPLIKALSKMFVIGALCCTDYVSFRDEDSEALIHRLGYGGKTKVFCDSAYSLDPPPIHNKPTHEQPGKLVVGFAPMAYGDPRLSPKHDPAVYNNFIQQLAAFAGWLLKSGYFVTLFCTDIGVDTPAIQDIERLLQNDETLKNSGQLGSLLRVHQRTTQELLLNMSAMDYVVACRFHAVVFAHLLNLPALAINHHPKVRRQMEDIGLPDYCVDLDNCGLDVLVKTFSSLVKDRDQIKRRMADKAARYKWKLSVQFDELFPSTKISSRQ